MVSSALPRLYARIPTTNPPTTVATTTTTTTTGRTTKAAGRTKSTILLVIRPTGLPILQEGAEEHPLVKCAHQPVSQRDK